MQSQFTDKAQNALAQAGRCARGLKQGYIGTEHILVGLLKEDTGVAAKVLADNGVEVDQVMEMIRDKGGMMEFQIFTFTADFS